jgi:hypothetical protein
MQTGARVRRAHHLCLTVFGLVLAPLAQPAIAITSTPITYVVSSLTVVSPGTQWATPNGVHVRGEVFTGIVTGDLKGTTDIVLNTDLNVTNPAVGFAGIQLQATFTITTATITWMGRVTDSGPPGDGINLVVARGSDGSRLQGRIIGEPDGTFLVEGTITSP